MQTSLEMRTLVHTIKHAMNNKKGPYDEDSNNQERKNHKEKTYDTKLQKLRDEMFV